MRRRRLFVVAVLLVAIAGSVTVARWPSGPGSGPPGGGLLSSPGRVGVVRIDPAGAIGPLHVNRSGRAQVIAWAGAPQVDRHGRSDARYEVLAYGCPQGTATKRYWSAYLVPCQTAFYLVDGKLSLFFTQDRRFAEAAGVRIGTPTKQAERLLRKRALAACTDAIGLQGEHSSMTVTLDGGKPHTVGNVNYLVGGHVGGFYLHGERNPGVTDCA
jgi:hypothetical protein